MKKIILCIILSIVILFSETPLYVRAEENTNLSSEEELSTQAETGLSLSVSYPADIKCGEPVIFTMTANGGGGTYKYRIHSLLNSSLESIYDVSYGSNGNYVDSNTFTFTFYASGTYYIRFSVMDMSSTPYQTVTTRLYEYPIEIQDANYPSVEQIVTNVAAQCQAACATEFEKAVWLHDWIIDNADYDYSYSYCSAEGVLARGKGTCESYHRAYEALLNKVGIQTGRIEGNDHVWTAVRMDGKWYQVDSTWDDMGTAYKGTYYEHMYFGLTDDIMNLVHKEHTGAVTGYESTALEDNYFIKTGEIKQWSNQFTDTIRQNIAAGKTEFSMQVSDAMPDNCKNVIYNLVAYQLSTEKWGEAELSVSYAADQLSCRVKNNNSGSNETVLTGKAKFVELLYQNALGRDAAQSEISHWVQELDAGKTGADVAYGFLFSKEFQDKNYNNGDYVEHLYLSLLGRSSDVNGKQNWIAYLENGASRKYVFRQFIISNEFQDLCNTCGIKKGDVSLIESRDQNYNVTRFVTRNYKQFLGRSYDENGLNNWTNVINKRAQTMQQVAYGFVFSDECVNKNLSNREFVKMLYRGCLDREGEVAGVNNWTKQLDSGAMNRIDVFWGFANSQEFSNLVQSYGL